MAQSVAEYSFHLERIIIDHVVRQGVRTCLLCDLRRVRLSIRQTCHKGSCGIPSQRPKNSLQMNERSAELGWALKDSADTSSILHERNLARHSSVSQA